MNYSEKIGKTRRAVTVARARLKDDPLCLDVMVLLSDADKALTEIEYYIETLERRLAMLEDEGRERE